MRERRWSRPGRRLAIGAGVLALSSGIAGGVYAGTRASDDGALPKLRAGADPAVESKVAVLLRKMTVQEKFAQLALRSDGQITDADAKAGVGSVFSLTDPQRINELQHIAVEESRLGIPILFAFDTIHGYRTIFPVPLGSASSFDPAVAQTDAAIGARESATVGIKQVYS